ncbi:hypothetical protein KA005_38875 [bacterium]|nr:hypothetical protein [bacterium]
MTDFNKMTDREWMKAIARGFNEKLNSIEAEIQSLRNEVRLNDCNLSDAEDLLRQILFILSQDEIEEPAKPNG